jgi:hypothetical protein
MDHVHYELYIRKTPASSWALDMATEDRRRAISAAEEALKEKRAVSVRVIKETLDDATREFRVVTILTKGAAETPKPKVQTEPLDALCLSLADLVHGPRPRKNRSLARRLAGPQHPDPF